MPVRPLVLALLLATAPLLLPAAAQADVIAFEATGTVSYVSGDTAVQPISPGMPFRATVWFDPARDGALFGPVGTHFQGGGVNVHVGGMTFASAAPWWAGLFARIGWDHFYIPNPDDYEGRTPVIEHSVRFDDYYVRVRDRSDDPRGYGATLIFRFPYDGPPVPPDERMLTSLDLARASESYMLVTGGDWTLPPERRLTFGGSFTDIRSLGLWRETPEPGTLALAALGALSLLARRRRRRRARG